MSENLRILVVDDEQSLCDVLKLNLEFEGYAVDVAYSAEEALQMPLQNYSLILLDVMMEEMSGYKFVKLLRKDSKYNHVAIILCTAKGSEEDLVDGFTSGADDYIKKPFSMKELVLRVKSVLRRFATQTVAENTNQLIIYKTLVLDSVKRECRIDGEEIFFTKKEFGILSLLLSNMDKIFSREEILDAVWEDDVVVVDRTIDVNINRMRKKLGIYGNNIITKQGYGYGFRK